MAVGTKILINDSKVDQKGTLTLCGCNQINSTGSLVYLTDQTQDYNCLSVPHVGYVTGITSGVLTCLNSCFYNKTEINKYTGDTDNRLTDIESITNVAVTGASNGITKIDSHNIELGGSLTKNTTISGSYGFGVNSNTIKFSGVTSGVEIGGSGLYLTANIPGSGGLLCLGGSGEVCQTSLAAFGGITGGTNGIVDCGNQNVGLGGVLSSSTTICGDGNNLSLGSAGSKLGLLTINSSENIGINSDKNLQISISGGTITTSDGMGLRYSSDYSDTFVDNSLITKRYVDNIVYGIDPKSAVLVATTANIDELIDIKTIDGISLTGGDRILVKDQDDKTENGIYIVNDGNWYRANDFDGTPSGEVTQGALIPVITGNTNANTLWILTSKDPITIDVDELIFTKFSQLIDVSSGNGIDISTVGAVKTISVDLADNSGLCFSSSELTINSSIAGSGLCWKNGVINVDVPTGGTTGVPVKFDDSYDLIVETSAINNVLGGVLSGSTNGLTDNNGIVCLGGQLITSTVICGNDVCGLTYQDTAITNKRGIQYADDYSATFVARSLVDAGFVTGLTSTSGIQTACNGLTKEGNVVVLGGTLTGNTEIDVDSYEFTICNSNSCVTIQDGYAELGTDSGETAVMLGSGSFDVAAGINVCVHGNCSGAMLIYACDDVEVVAGINVGVYGNCSGAMLIYACDVVMELCNSFNYFSVYNNCNQNLILNGNNDIVCLSNCDSNLTICGSDNLIELNACNSSIKLSEDYMCFLLENSDCLVINNSSTIFTSINGTGIEYGDCYHDTYTSRSLVDKEYVDNIKVNADNGLSVSGGTIVLGGTLTGDTTIYGDCNSLNIPNLKEFNVVGDCIKISPQHSSVCHYKNGTVIGGSGIICGCNSVVIGGSDLTSGGYGNYSLSMMGGIACGCQSIAIGRDICWPVKVPPKTGTMAYGDYSISIGYANCVNSCYGTIIGGTFNSLNCGNNYSIILGGCSIGIPENSYCNTAIVPNLVIWETPSSGSVSDSVLVWNSTDKMIKTVSGCDIGDSNNNYLICGISANTSFTNTGKTYLIAVNTTNSSICVTLPSSVSNGRAFKIKDVSGNALTNNVIICSHGGTHKFDGNNNALINTDYGSLELVYSEELGICGWFAVSYMN